MAFTKENLGERLFAEDIPSRGCLADMLAAMCRNFLVRAALNSLRLDLDRHGVLRMRQQGGKVETQWNPHGAPCARNAREACGRVRDADVAVPVVHAGNRVGSIAVQPLAGDQGNGLCADLLEHFARHCARLAARVELEHWSKERFGQPIRLIGLSPAMRELDRFIDIAAQHEVPAMIRGEFGTGKIAVAAAIHRATWTEDRPFVSIDCRCPRETPARWVEKAQKGTLFLSDIDELPRDLQRQLTGTLPPIAASNAPVPQAGAIRLVASHTRPIAELVEANLFSAILAAQIDFLRVTIPPLRDRKSDILPMACEVVEGLGYRAETKLSPELIAAARRYDWPGNEAEFTRTIGRLAAMTGARPIAGADIRLHARRLGHNCAGAADLGGPHSLPPSTSSVELWAKRATDRNDDLADIDHDVRKALRHLGSNYAEEVTLADLAEIAGIAPQRLSARFRAAIGTPFKPVLRQIRILAACERLESDPETPITDLAFEVGFGDLSYFERSFRNAVAQSPREYRRQCRTG